jgi:hypothetical protein
LHISDIHLEDTILSELTLPMTESIGNMQLTGNSALGSISAPRLKVVYEGMHIVNSPNLTYIEAPLLADLTELTFSNTGLEALEPYVPGLKNVAKFDVSDNAQLHTLDDGDYSISGALFIKDNPNLCQQVIDQWSMTVVYSEASEVTLEGGDGPSCGP